MSDDTTEAEFTAPQSPGDPGYEPPAINPELDGEGGTVFKMGDQEFASMEEAEEARADLVQQHTDATAPEEETEAEQQ